MSDILQWIPTYGLTSVSWQAKTYIHQFCADTGCRLEDWIRVITIRYGDRQTDRQRQRERQGNPCCRLILLLLLLLLLSVTWLSQKFYRILITWGTIQQLRMLLPRSSRWPNRIGLWDAELFLILCKCCSPDLDFPLRLRVRPCKRRF